VDDEAPGRSLGPRGSERSPYEVDVRAVGPGRPEERLAVAEAEALAEAAADVQTSGNGAYGAPDEPQYVPPEVDGRSPYVTTCPFFRAEARDGSLVPPIEGADPANRCAAFGDPQPQSKRQQELVCLESGHVNCPRYLRGALMASKTRSPRRTLTRATLVAIALLIVSAGASFAFVLVRGGLSLPAASSNATPSPGPLAVASFTPRLTPSPPAATPTAKPAATPTAKPAATPAPTPAVTAGPTPRPSSDRYALLEPCPTKPDCFIYTIRRGDNLTAIAHYFGTTLDTIRRLNPWTKTKGISAGDKLILPPPTR
jgi:hypothetical protein